MYMHITCKLAVHLLQPLSVCYNIIVQSLLNVEILTAQVANVNEHLCDSKDLCKQMIELQFKVSVLGVVDIHFDYCYRIK